MNDTGDVRVVWVAGDSAGNRGNQGNHSNLGISHPVTSACRNIRSSTQSVNYCCPVLTRTGMCWQILLKLSCIKLYENSFSHPQVLYKDRSKLIVEFLQLVVVNTPKNCCHNLTSITDMSENRLIFCNSPILELYFSLQVPIYCFHACEEFILYFFCFQPYSWKIWLQRGKSYLSKYGALQYIVTVIYITV
jgi:hypothetical protein